MKLSAVIAIVRRDVGLVVEGMPIGSPGMDGPNLQRYDVLSLDRLGRVSVYARK